MGQLVAGAVGAVVGFYVGGPAGAQAGFAIGSALYAVTQPGPHSEGPKLSDLKLTGTAYGEAIPFILGHPRIAGQIIYASEKRPVANTTEQGGKGGGATYTEYTYEIDVLFLMSDNECDGVARIWKDGKLIYSILDGSSTETIDASTSSDQWTRLTFYDGNASQLPDPTYEAAVGIGKAPAYRGRSSIFIEGLKLPSSGTMSNLTFEMSRVATTDGGDVLFEALFDEDGADTAPDPATITTTNPGLVIYNGVGQVQLLNDFTNNLGGQIAWSSSKFLPIDGSDKFTLEAKVNFHGIRGPSSGSSDLKRFFRFVGTGLECSFGSRVIDGEVYLYTYWSDLGSIETNVGPSNSNLYRIVFDAGTVYFYNGDTLVDSRAIPGGSFDQVVVGHPSPGFNGSPGIEGYEFEYAIGYFGDGPTARITLEDETLRNAVDMLLDRAGYEADEYDTSALDSITKPVRAMAVASIGATRASIELLMSTHYFDCVLSDKLYFFPRPTTPVATITWDELGASNSPEGDPDPLTIKYRNEIEIPAQYAVTYINVANDYQNDTQFSDRAISSQSSTTGVNIALGMTPAEAKGISDAMVLDNFASIAGATLKIPFTRNELEATDVVTVNGPEESFRMRLVKKDDSGGILTFDAVVDDARALLSAQITDEDYTPQTEVQAVVDTLWYSMDIAILRDADNVPGWYVAAKREDGSGVWPGAGIFRSWDEISYSQVATFTSESVFGTATTILPDWTGGNVFDNASTLTVDVGAGSLYSSTRSAMLADQTINVLLVGREIIRFRTATMTAPGIYVLSGLLRGLRGTYWAMVDHIGFERVVLLTVAGLRRVQTEASQINVERDVKGITFNKPLSSATAENFTDTGIALKPFAGRDLRIARDSSGDIAGMWRRMTRLSYRFLTPGIEPPIGEAAELYDVEIYDDNTYTTVVRTISSLTDSEFEYSAADQTTDFGSPKSTIYVRVYQRSATVGRGYALEGQG